MSHDPGRISEADLHAYIDGRLEPARRLEVEAWLAAHPEEARRLRDYQALNQGLHALFDPVLEEPVPARLLKRRKTVRFRPLMQAAGVAGWLLIGGVLGWFVRDFAGGRTSFDANLVKEAVAAHAVYTPERRHPVEVSAAQESHLVAWLSMRLGTEIRAPDLQGYELLGGRLLPADAGPAAQFMYQDASGRRLTLFVRKGAISHRDTAFRFVQEGAVSAFYWIDRDLGYALVGNLDKSELYPTAHRVYQQLSP